MRRTRGIGRLLAAAAVLVGAVGVGTAIVRDGEPSRCEELNDRLAELDGHHTDGPAQSWDDIYTLQVDITERLAIQHDLDEAGCDKDAARASSSTTGEVPYLVRPGDEWVLRRAINPKGAVRVEPSLDWFAEYERGPAEAPERVRLSVHRVTIDGLADELVGFSLEAATIGGRDALAGRASDPTGPSIALFTVADGVSAMALSYELSAPDLAKWSGALADSDEAGWIESGGVVER